MSALEGMYMMFDWASLDIDSAGIGDYKGVEYVTRQPQKKHEKPFFWCAASTAVPPLVCPQ